MHTYRTVVTCPALSPPIGLQNGLLTLGSCFSDVIGERLRQHKFHTTVNPFGVIFNPISLHKAVRYALTMEMSPPHTFLQAGDVYLNYDFHSEISSLRADELSRRLETTLNATHAALKKARWLIITYGTAWVYERLDTGEIVSNCHKMPASLFRKRLLSVEEITASFRHLLADLHQLNPDLQVLLTVSPVRHIKDTLPGNSVSKAILRVAVDHLSRDVAVHYFPAYEMVTDDLRDYRFYKADLIHPNEQAEDYIWQHFTAHCLDQEARAFVHRWTPILRALSHRPFHPASAGHQHFLKQTLEQLHELRAVADVEEEIQRIRQQLLP